MYCDKSLIKCIFSPPSDRVSSNYTVCRINTYIRRGSEVVNSMLTGVKTFRWVNVCLVNLSSIITSNQVNLTHGWLGFFLCVCRLVSLRIIKRFFDQTVTTVTNRYASSLASWDGTTVKTRRDVVENTLLHCGKYIQFCLLCILGRKRLWVEKNDKSRGFLFTCKHGRHCLSVTIRVRKTLFGVKRLMFVPWNHQVTVG